MRRRRSGPRISDLAVVPIDRRLLAKKRRTGGEVSKKCHGTEAVPADCELQKVTDGWLQSGGQSTVRNWPHPAPTRVVSCLF